MVKRDFHLILIGILIIARLAGAQNTTTDDKTALVVANATRLRDDYNRWNHASNPGMQMVGKEIRRENRPGKGLVVRYQLVTTGVPEGQYDLLLWAVGSAEPRMGMRGVSISKDGSVYCAGRKPSQCRSDKGPDQPVEFEITSRPGTAFHYAVSNSVPKESPGSIFVTTTIIPDPIAAHDNRCGINVVSLAWNFEVAYLTGDGFNPGSAVQMHGESLGEVHDAKLVADSSGKISALLVPLVAGHKNGTTELKVSGADCTQRVTFHWGEQ